MAEAHLARYGRRATGTQESAWLDSRRLLARSLRGLLRRRPEAGSWGMAFEYELPWEGGRRPDLVLLAAGRVLVLEFKMAPSAGAAGLDQVAAYARDLALDHGASRDRPVRPILVPTRSDGALVERDGVLIVPPARLAGSLGSLPPADADTDARPIDLDAWLLADYAPLPGVVEAARRIFRREPLPALRRAEGAGIPAVLDRLADLAADAEARGGRHVVPITGDPGAGKTLVGLEFVHP